MTCGVYKITNVKTDKVYIGSSVNIEKRMISHRSSLNCNRHHSYHLQASWKHHGQSCFDFETVLICDKGNLKFYEQSIMEFYRSYDRDSGYNIAPLAGRLSDETSEECKQALKAQARLKAKKHLWRGQELCLAEIAESENIDFKVLCRRFSEEGWDLERAASTPTNKNGKTLTAFGKTRTIQEWCDELDLNYFTVQSRLASGWNEQEALSKPIQQETFLSLGDKTLNINQWAELTGIPASTISQRIRKLGWSTEDALTTPKGKKRNKR